MLGRLPGGGRDFRANGESVCSKWFGRLSVVGNDTCNNTCMCPDLDLQSWGCRHAPQQSLEHFSSYTSRTCENCVGLSISHLGAAETSLVDTTSTYGQPQPSAMHLFFGCRHENQDFLFRSALTQMLTGGTLSSLHVAFSRDQRDKVYVQHRMKEEMELVGSVIKGGGFIFVCGDGACMAKDVRSALIEIIRKTHSCSMEAAQALLQDLSSRQRYVQDIWS